jgi:hypothetical protein
MTTSVKQKRGSRKPSGAETTAPLPEWVEQTPDIDYSMEAFLETTIEEVALTRVEYIALKGHLAKMRGLAKA